MRILLDTHAFLWLTSDDMRVSKKAKKLFLDEENEFFLSLASIWEMAIKISLEKLELNQPLEKFILNQLQENFIDQLTISFRHVTKVRLLPFYHRDPFDRLLIAQAQEEGMAIMSSDTAFDSYDVERLW